MNNLLTKENIKIENLIYEIRGKQVMLDSDLAILYNCKNGTKSINLAVKRNIKKFPEEFMFQITDNEKEILWFQNETANISKKSRNNNYVFTEQGVAMLSSILNTEVAIDVSVHIMRAFVTMKNYISNNLIENNYYKEMVIRHDNDIKLLKEQFKTKNNHLFYEGQIYDTYSLMIEIFNTSINKIIIIDNYVDKNLLDIISKTNKQVIVITNKYNNDDYTKYKSQYNNITLKIDNSFHDRFIIIDDKILYHSGASFKDLGKKCFSITKIEDEEILQNLLNKL